MITDNTLDVKYNFAKTSNYTYFVKRNAQIQADGGAVTNVVYAPSNSTSPVAPYGFLGIANSGAYNLDLNSTNCVDLSDSQNLNMCIRY